MKDKLVLRCVIEKEEGIYNALCLDLDVSSFGETLEEAKANLQEAVELYLEYALETDRIEELAKRQVPANVLAKYKRASKKDVASYTPRVKLFRTHDQFLVRC